MNHMVTLHLCCLDLIKTTKKQDCADCELADTALNLLLFAQNNVSSKDLLAHLVS